MKTKKISLLVLSFSVFFICCQKKSNCPYSQTTDYFHNLSANNKATPYTGFDTLVFISNVGDTAILFGQGKKYLHKTFFNMPAPSGCDFPEVTIHDDSLALIFTGNNSLLSKIGYHGYYDSKYKGLYGELTDFTVNNYTSNGLVINETSLIMDTSCLYYSTDTICYSHRRITVNGIIYYCTLTTSPPYVYYSPSFGIVRIDSIAGKSWYLKK